MSHNFAPIIGITNSLWNKGTTELGGLMRHMRQVDFYMCKTTEKKCVCVCMCVCVFVCERYRDIETEAETEPDFGTTDWRASLSSNLGTAKERLKEQTCSLEGSFSHLKVKL